LDKAKPFQISKKVVWDAYLKVKANKGAAGVDDQSIEEFEKDLKDNLYKHWNRMSSGTYFPPPVRTVMIPKKGGGQRGLGIPTVSDRIAQMVAKIYLEPEVEPCFHPDSFGYRPDKSAHDALAAARERCWRYDWVVDLDIKGFFDNLDHCLLLEAVKRHTDCKWILLYVERWLKAPAQLEDGTIVERTKGTPQGGVASPLLANIFLHHVFDEWMKKMYPYIPFERYADDILLHCKNEGRAHFIRDRVEERLKRCKLELHPEKTRIVYCKDELRRKEYPTRDFDFLGYKFRPRLNRTRAGKLFVSFSPAVSDKAKNEIRQTIRGWRLHLRSGSTIEKLAEETNPVVRGWINYYGRFIRGELHKPLQQIDRYLVRWARSKYKSLWYHQRRARKWVQRVQRQKPNLFAHWALGWKSCG
jgi:RNA-directed DNA polymerase